MLFCIVTFNLWLHFNKLLTYLLYQHRLERKWSVSIIQILRHATVLRVQHRHTSGMCDKNDKTTFAVFISTAQQLCSVRRPLTIDTQHTLATTFTSSLVDYCNAVLDTSHVDYRWSLMMKKDATSNSFGHSCRLRRYNIGSSRCASLAPIVSVDSAAAVFNYVPEYSVQLTSRLVTSFVPSATPLGY